MKRRTLLAATPLLFARDVEFTDKAITYYSAEGCDDAPLGFCGISATGHVHSLYVRADRVRHGIGTALLERAIDLEGFEFEFTLADVEELNRRSARGEFDVSKASFHAALQCTRDLCVLPVGAALGFGVGPVLLGRAGAPKNAS